MSMNGISRWIYVDYDILFDEIFFSVSIMRYNSIWSLWGTICLSQEIILPHRPACFSNPSVVKNRLIIQSPISALWVDIDTKVGSIIDDFYSTKEVNKSNWLLIFSIVTCWLAITWRAELKSPEQICDITSKAVCFYSLIMKLLAFPLT